VLLFGQGSVLPFNASEEIGFLSLLRHRPPVHSRPHASLTQSPGRQSPTGIAADQSQVE
jgi:hypothetical protein